MVRPAPGAAPLGGRVSQPDDARPTLSGLAGRLRGLRLATRPRVSQDAAALHGFHLYDRQSVHIGTLTASALITDRADVERYWAQFERLAGLALVGDDARAALAETATRYRQ